MIKRNNKILQLLPVVMLLCLGLNGWSQNKTAEQLISEASEIQASGDAEKSLTMLNEAFEMSAFAQPQDANQLAEINNLQAISYSMKFEWAKAIKYGQVAQRRISLDIKSSQYPVTLYNLATFYAGRGSEGDYDKAIQYVTKSREFFGKKTKEYFYCNNNLVYYYLLNNNRTMALSLVEDAIDSGTKIFEDNKATYIKELWKYANMISELGDYELATYYAKACLRIMEENDQAHTNDYIRRTIKLAGFYYQKRDFSSEINTLTNIVQISKEMDGEESSNYVDCLRKLALAYNHEANEIRGEKKYAEEYDSCRAKNEYYEGLSREILLKTGNIYEIRTYQIPLISNQAHDFYNQKKYQDAIHYEEVAYVLYNKERDSVNVAQSTNNIANYFYHYNNQVDSALIYGRISVDLYDKIPRNSRSKGLSYNNMAMFTHAKGNARDAVNYELKAISTLELCGDTISDIYVKSLGNASVYCHEMGDEKKAGYYSTLSATALARTQAYNKQQELAQAKKLKRKERKAAIKKLETTHHVDNNMVVVQWNKAMYSEVPSEVHDAYSKASQIQRDVFLQNYPAMTVADRTADWAKRRYVFDYAETLAFSYSKEDSLVMDAYNALLIREGMPKYIQNGDSTAITIDWKKMVSALDANTAIVRFFLVPTDNKGDAYSAIVLCKEWTAPKIVRQLFTDSDLSMLRYDPQGSFKSIYQTTDGKALTAKEGRFGRMVWKRILADFTPEITSVKYFTTGVGIFDEYDPATVSLEDNEAPINQKYKMVKE